MSEDSTKNFDIGHEFKNFKVKVMEVNKFQESSRNLLEETSQEFTEMTMTEFFKRHESEILYDYDEAVSNIEISDAQDEAADVFYYMVKSIKVKWRKLNNSYMHMFIDTTHIKNLEKQKAINKCQHIMLSSISHEFRTPINAFSNSLEMLKFNSNKIGMFVEKNVKDQNALIDYSAIHSNMTKFLKISDVSSKILMALIEDILDLAKLEAGTFSINVSSFHLKKLIEDITDIFSFQ